MRDVTWIAGRMRAEDWREIACQLPEGAQPIEAAAFAMAGEAWVARIDGQPVAAFGVMPVTASVTSVWCWGTDDLPHVAREIGRFIREECLPVWLRAGYVRMEARSIAGHVTAHRWLKSLGAKSQPCPCWGRGGEDFVLFYWTVKDNPDVLLRAEVGHQHQRQAGAAA